MRRAHVYYEMLIYGVLFFFLGIVGIVIWTNSDDMIGPALAILLTPVGLGITIWHSIAVVGYLIARRGKETCEAQIVEYGFRARRGIMSIGYVYLKYTNSFGKEIECVSMMELDWMNNHKIGDKITVRHNKGFAIIIE